MRTALLSRVWHDRILGSGHRVLGFFQSRRTAWLLGKSRRLVLAAVAIVVATFGVGASQFFPNKDYFSAREAADVSALRMSLADRVERQALIHKAIGNPQGLATLTQSQLLLLFNRPDLIRHEGASLSWHYIADTCVIDLYFSGSEQTPAYLNFRGLKGQMTMPKKTEPDACVMEVLSRDLPESEPGPGVPAA